MNSAMWVKNYISFLSQLILIINSIIPLLHFLDFNLYYCLYRAKGIENVSNNGEHYYNWLPLPNYHTDNMSFTYENNHLYAKPKLSPFLIYDGTPGGYPL